MPYKNPEDRRANDRAKHPAKYAKRLASGIKCAKCDKPAWSFGLCNTHYTAQRRASPANEAIKATRRRTWLMQQYGLTDEGYEALLVAQNGACAICFRTKPNGNGGKFFHIDHDHETGKVRGLLCSKCNTSIGLMDDNVPRLLSAVAYLRRSAP